MMLINKLSDYEFSFAYVPLTAVRLVPLPHMWHDGLLGDLSG